MKILILWTLFMIEQVLSKQWVDPYNMNIDSKELGLGDAVQGKKPWVDPYEMKNVDVKKYLKEAKTGNVHGNDNGKINIGENNSLVYLKRVINLLLNSANMDNTNDFEHRGHLRFTIDSDNLNFLKEFSTMKIVSIEDLRKLDSILSKSLERTYSDTISDMMLSAQEKFSQFIFNQNGLPLLGLCLLPYIAYNLIKSNFSIWYIFRYSIIMVVMFDFVQRYQQLSEEAEDHNMQLKYSLKCDTSKMTWGQYFKFLTANEDCEKKVISLLEVLLNQMKNVIIIPLSAAGTGMGQFGSELWKNLPFPWNILIFPIMLIFCAILVAIIMTTINNNALKFNIMHLFHLEFGDKKEGGITGNTLDKLLDAVSHRQLLQDLKSGKGKTPPKKKNEGKPVENKKEKKENGKSVKQKATQNETNKKSVNTEQESKCEDSAGNKS